MASQPDVILYTYDDSPFGRRVDWYLTLSNRKYSKCRQPDRLPRPDLEKLGIAYRRIPLLSIGRDFYIDTRLIINKLEQLFPESSLNSKDPFEQGLNRVFESWTVDGGLVVQTALLLPPDRGVVQDPGWITDRQDMSGMPLSADFFRLMRPLTLSQIRLQFEALEHGLFADGRSFVFNTPKPTLGDVNAALPFDFLLNKKLGMIDYLEPEYIGEKLFPKVFAYVDRLRKAVAEQEEKNGWTPGWISSEDTLKKVLASDYYEKEGDVDQKDPLQLKKGDYVEVSPLDNSVKHFDRGNLVALSLREVVIEIPVKVGDGHLRLHFPRQNFRVAPASKA